MVQSYVFLHSKSIDMNKVIFFIAYFIIANLSAQSFDILSGPMYGHFTDSTQNFWLLIRPKTNQVSQKDWISQLNKDVFKYFEDSTLYRIKNITESSIAYQNNIILKGVVNKKKPTAIGKDISFLGGVLFYANAVSIFEQKKTKNI